MESEQLLKARHAEALFPAFDSPGALDHAYPHNPQRLRHGLVSHPLLDIEALARAALRMDPAHVERRQAHSVNGGAFAMHGGDAPIDQVIRTIAGSESWVMLRFVEQLEEYRELLAGLLDAIAPVTGPVTGMRGFVFISAPGTLTPFHFDPEFNILFHIAGIKRFATCPVAEPFISMTKREDYHASGDNLLPWREGLGEGATVHELRSGDALFVPWGAPHWVEVSGDGPSISLSLTWQDGWSERTADALYANRALRRLGVAPAPLPDWPRAPAIRALAGRVLRKVATR